MRRLASVLIAALPFELRSRQALDETLLDWAHEESSAATIARRAVVHLRGVLSVARAMAAASIAETRLVPVGWLVGQLGLYGLLPTVAILGIALLGSSFDSLDGWSRLAFLLLASPTVLFLNLPVAVMLGILRRSYRRNMPTVGTGVVVFILALLLGGLASPVSFEMGREFFDLRTQTADGRTIADVRSDPDASFPSALNRAVGRWPDSFSTAQSVDELMTFSALSGVTAMLAGAMCALYRQDDRRKLRWIVVVLLGQGGITFGGQLVNTLVGSPAGDLLCVAGLLVACVFVERSVRAHAELRRILRTR